MSELIKRLVYEEEGQDLVEYALLLVFYGSCGYYSASCIRTGYKQRLCQGEIYSGIGLLSEL